VGYRYHYYACRKKKATSDAGAKRLTCPRAKAGWLEDLVWTDVRSFLEDPGEDFHLVRLAPLRGEARLAGAACIEERLNVGFG